MSNNVIQSSFDGGEYAPSFAGRVDTEQYKIGAALLRNFFVDYRGGASNRGGSQFVIPLKNSLNPGRLEEFRFSTTQNYILVIEDYSMRVIVNGAAAVEPNVTVTGITLGADTIIGATAHGYASGDGVYISLPSIPELDGQYYVVGATTSATFELLDVFGSSINSSAYPAFVAGTVARVFTYPLPYAAADVGALKFSQDNDVVTITHPNYTPQRLNRYSPTSWTLIPDTFQATIYPGAAPTLSTSLSASTSSSTSAQFGYLYTAVDVNNQESQASPITLTAVIVDIATQAGSISINMPVVAGAKYFNIYKAYITVGDTAAPPVFPIGTTFGYIGTTMGMEFVDNNITPNYTRTPPTHQDPFGPSQITNINMTAGGTGATAASTVTVTDPTGTGFSGIPIVLGGIVTGVLVLSGGRNYTAPVVSFTGVTGATATAVVGPASGTNPSLSTYFQQRKIYANTTNQPETLWATKPGLFGNMDVSSPVNDGDSYSFTLAALELNDIRWAIPMPGGLVIFTGAGIWQVSGGYTNVPVTPSNIVANPQGYNGAAEVRPLPINYNMLVVQEKGSKVYEYTYNFFANIYTGVDTTILSSHLFNPHTITKWAYAREPNKIIWAIREDGVKLSLTYVKSQQVNGWSWHTTQGIYESIASVQEGTEDAVYTLVRRFINGQWMRYVERDASRHLTNGADDAWFVDAGLSTSSLQLVADLVCTGDGVTNIVLTADSPVFNSSYIGYIFRGGGGIGAITAVTALTATVALTSPLTNTVQDAPTPTFTPILSGNWNLAPKVSTIYGLRHLNGATVQVFADAGVQSVKTVVDGAIVLDEPASRVVVGLGYSAQLQTLPIDIGTPTIQGKRKKISAVDVKVVSSRGLKLGTSFAELFEIKEYAGVSPIPLITSIERVLVGGGYTVGGQICVQQDYPLPTTILAVIHEVTLGDQ